MSSDSAKNEAPLKKKKGDYHHGNLREALTQAAIELLEAEGTQALSLRGVARRAGVSQTAPYRHFADKEALLASVAQRGFELLKKGQLEALEQIDNRAEHISEVGKSYVRFALAHPHILRLMFGPDISCKGDYPDLQVAAGEAFGVIQTLVTEQLSDSDATDTNPMMATLGAWSLVHGISTLLLDGHLKQKLESGEVNVEQLTEMITSIYSRGLKT